MKYSIVLLLILCITAHATPDMKKRLLKEKSRRAQHAQHNLGAPKLRANVCDTHFSTDNGALDRYGDSCSYYIYQPSWCGSYDCTQSYIDGGHCTTLFDANAMCCGCGGGVSCEAGFDDCGVCGGDNACHDACGVPNGDDSTCTVLTINADANTDCQAAKDYYNDQCSC